jgi:iron complex outermembrane receptor protein
MNLNRARLPWALVLLIVAAAAVPVSTAFAADSPPKPTPLDNTDNLQEVVVTGTQIRGVEVVGSAVVTLSQQEMQDSGLPQTSDLLRSLPFVMLSGSSEINANSTSNFANLNTTRLNGINIRGLGVGATLILLNGRRVVPGGVGGQVFDPSSIPTIALERMEVVPDGSSAIYGADAVAGVANLIVRRNFDGAEVQASYGDSKGFGGQQKYGAIFGHTWGGGSVTVAGEFFSHPHLQTSTYASLYNANLTGYCVNGVCGTNQRTLGGAPGNIAPTAATSFGLPAGTGVGVTPASFSTTLNRTSQYTGTDILPSTERHSIVLNLQQTVRDNVNLWMEGYYSDRFVNLLQTPVNQANLQVPSTNPFFIPGASRACTTAGITTLQCNYVTYSFANDLPQPRRYGESLSSQLALGATIDLPKGYQLSIYGTTNMDKEDDISRNQLNLNAVNAALALTSPATALNVTGSGGNNNPSTLAALYGYTLIESRFTRNVANAKLDGPLFSMPGGQVRMALGGEIVKDSLWNLGTYTNTGGANTSLFSFNYISRLPRSTKSEFAEFFLPLIGAPNAMRAARQLTLDLAVRHDSYSDLGTTTNPKYGFTWIPIDSLHVHGSYGTSFRAPTLCDTNPLCTGIIRTQQTADPGYTQNRVVNPGVPAGSSIVAFVVGGNANLRPETATTRSLGFDFKPTRLPGLTVSVNYFNIDYKNIIDTPAAFNATVSTNPAYASLFVRNPTPAQVTAFWSLLSVANPSGGFAATQVNLLAYGTRQNVGEAKMEGLDFSANYHWDTRLGAWVAGITSEYVTQYLYSIVAGAPFVERVNQISGNSTAFPLRLTGRVQLGWSKAGFRANTFVNYHNSYTNIAASVNPTVPQTIGSFTTVDLNLAYGAGDSASGPLRKMTVSLTATNLFSTAPPFALIGTTEYDPANASPMGRLFTLELRKKF